MGCSSSQYVNFANLQADGCCTLLAANPLQYNSAQFYNYFRPFIMELVEKAAAADMFGHPKDQEQALDNLMDIHMLYGFLLAVQYQREWDQELNEPCHEDLGNLYYWDKYQFECITKYFLCKKIDILPALSMFDIDTTPQLQDGIGAMYIEQLPGEDILVTPAVADCDDSSQSCSGDVIVAPDSFELLDITFDGSSISPPVMTDSTLGALLTQIETYLESLVGINLQVVITPTGGENFTINVCVPHYLVDAIGEIKITTRARYQPPAAICNEVLYDIIGGPTQMQLNWNGFDCNSPPDAAFPLTFDIILRDIDWTSPADDYIVATQQVITSNCGAEATSMKTIMQNYLDSLWPGPGNWTFLLCIEEVDPLPLHTHWLHFNTTGAIIFDKFLLRVWGTPPEDTRDCEWTINPTGGADAVYEHVVDPCFEDKPLFHVS